MNGFASKTLPVLLLTFVLVTAGCDRSSTPPPPLTLEELPAAFQKGFVKAKADARNLSDQIVAAVQAKEYSRAYVTLQNLLREPSLSKQEESLAARAALTVNAALQSAQAQGDPQAAETLAIQHKMK